jgi:subtilisin family serine protease
MQRARTIPGLKRGLTLAAALVVIVVPAAAPARNAIPDVRRVEVVVTMAAPPLALAPWRSLAANGVGSRLDVRAAPSVAYLRRLDGAQTSLAIRIRRLIPGAAARWRYGVVVDGMSVVVPRNRVADLARVPGVARVWPNRTFRPTLDRTPTLIGATQLWGPDLSSAGAGTKIGIIDEGIQPDHPFFNPAGYTYPAGFPKGDTRFTTPKIIVARAFAPPGTTYANASLPFDPKESEHGTHVAGIAAGNHGTPAVGTVISGIAPRAYLGNYKALSVPTPEFGLDGNAPEIVAAIEAAVRDGMDVINCSFGEAEIDPARDIAVHAIDAAAAAGVVPVVSAGNDFSDFGNGSVGSPANAPRAIAVGASTGAHGSPRPDRIVSFSSGAPTPYSFQLKPEVVAPGSGVLSSVPTREGTWDQFSGTSMAAPHVAGGAALLRERHPTWTVAQIKAALVLTGAPVTNGTREVSPMREGGGRINLVAADKPLVFAAPSTVTFGLLRPRRKVTRRVALSDAGGGAGRWSVSAGPGVSAARTITAPGTLRLVASSGSRPESDVSGFVSLTQAGQRRRIPYWFRVERPHLGLDRTTPLARAGVYGGTTVGAPTRVAAYRYPDLAGASLGFAARLPGPERVYRFRLRRRVANFGVVVMRGGVQPRVVRGADENRLAGYTALPLDLNPYRNAYGEARPVAGVVLPGVGTYSIVFDSPRRVARGPFSFRFWVGDTTPPTVRVVSRTAAAVRMSVRDAGAGVDPKSVRATIDGRARTVSYARGTATISLVGLGAGSHTLVFRAADYQETKNMEDVGPVLPNTRTLELKLAVSG